MSCTSVNVYPDNISDRSNSMVMHHHSEISFCSVQGQSHYRFYEIFRNTETFATQISLMVHHHKTGHRDKIFLLLHMA